MNKSICRVLITTWSVFFAHNGFADGENKLAFTTSRHDLKNYPYGLFVQFNPVQHVNSKGIGLNVTYENRSDETLTVLLSPEYCPLRIEDNNWQYQEVQQQRSPRGMFLFATELITRTHKGTETLHAGQIKTINITIDKMAVHQKTREQKVPYKEKLVDITPGLYKIHLNCMVFVFPLASKGERQGMSASTSIFYVLYKP